MKKKTLKPRRKNLLAPKDCSFCKEKIEPKFIDTENLTRYLTERGKIIGRSRSGLCAKHQRHFTSAVKHARFLALLPFTSRE